MYVLPILKTLSEHLEQFKLKTAKKKKKPQNLHNFQKILQKLHRHFWMFGVMNRQSIRLSDSNDLLW